ncbi:hypothetical protein DPM13_09600 [Paracoccus mutanolyticus]|uniref:HTH cro/C1-type domain-containing protein n=1 Tax=Paracoccus mutanolyticus TaxID=1499308 RepID=A0ABN5M5Q8_9RHOB|nr:hypothetical protein DPM13_09600 [Paracoccus mutanolyticus]
MNTLRATRRSCGLTQASVAASAGISLPTLRALERGEGGVRALAAVMAVLDLRWGWAPDRVQAARASPDRARARGSARRHWPIEIGVRDRLSLRSTRSGREVATLDWAAAVLGVGWAAAPRAVMAGARDKSPSAGSGHDAAGAAAVGIGHFAGRMSGTVRDDRGHGAGPCAARQDRMVRTGHRGTRFRGLAGRSPGRGSPQLAATG